MAIYELHKADLKPIIQDQIKLFFNDNLGSNGRNFSVRNKENIPDYGVFLMYLTLWEPESNENVKWVEIGPHLLHETLTRQIKWVLNKYPELINNGNQTAEDRKKRVKNTFEVTGVSRRLFMFQYFFLTQACQLFATNGKKSVIMTPTSKYCEYNENFGRSKDKSLPLKLQNFVKKIHKCGSYLHFFKFIKIKYYGCDAFANWLLNCMYESQDKRYHKPYVYYSMLKKIRDGKLKN